jgi:hypothetical protein
MRYGLVLAFTLAGAAALCQDPYPPPVHSEEGVGGRIEVEAVGRYNRLIINKLLWGTQINETFVRHWADDLGFIVPGSPWDVVVTAGANAAYRPREDPLSYYHRTGPVGAIFRELRTRKSGKDAAAPVAVFGLGAGTEAAYALRGQSITFYETDPALKRLVADSDKYFTYVADARKRGATIDVRVGKRRELLAADKDRKYAVILVDQAESYPVGRDVVTKEAVQLYFDRMTEDGILGLHISNKYIDHEPMIARIADELKLEARLWSDSVERGRPGKTASSWLVLAKSTKALGTLAAPLDEQEREFASRFRPPEALPGIRAWTDKEQDVWILTMIPSLQELRRLLGLPTPLWNQRRRAEADGSRDRATGLHAGRVRAMAGSTREERAEGVSQPARALRDDPAGRNPRRSRGANSKDNRRNDRGRTGSARHDRRHRPLEGRRGVGHPAARRGKDPGRVRLDARDDSTNLPHDLLAAAQARPRLRQVPGVRAVKLRAALPGKRERDSAKTLAGCQADGFGSAWVRRPRRTVPIPA